MITKSGPHYKRMKDELVKAGYKKSHADKMLDAARKHAKSEGYAVDKKGKKKEDGKYKQSMKDKMDEKKGMKKKGRK